jgi:hypothetical protein
MLPTRFFLPLLIFLVAAQAHAAAPWLPAPRQTLPDLAAPSDLPANRFAIDQNAASVGGDTRDQTWNTRLTYAAERSMYIDYGLQFDPRLAGGAKLVVGGRHQEVLLNTIVAPEKSLRLQFSGGQLRQVDDFQFASGSYADRVPQQHYLLAVRKSWGSAFFSDFSLTAWRAHAGEVDPGQKAMPLESGPDGQPAIDPRTLAAGAQTGYLLHLGVAPLPQARLELGAGMEHTSYDFADGSAAHDGSASRRLHYTQYLDNCARLQGHYQSQAAWRSFGVSIANGAWSLGASRTLDHDSGDGGFAVSAGYTISLGKSSGRTASCGSDLKHARSFGSMLSRSVARSPNLPAAPLVRVDPTAQPMSGTTWAGQAD